MGRQRVWAIEHLLGVTLIVSGSGRDAAKYAEQLFGAASGPYRIPRNQAQAILYARTMGAKLVNPTPTITDEFVTSGQHFKERINQTILKRSIRKKKSST